MSFFAVKKKREKKEQSVLLVFRKIPSQTSLPKTQFLNSVSCSNPKNWIYRSRSFLGTIKDFVIDLIATGLLECKSLSSSTAAVPVDPPSNSINSITGNSDSIDSNINNNNNNNHKRSSSTTVSSPPPPLVTEVDSIVSSTACKLLQSEIDIG